MSRSKAQREIVPEEWSGILGQGERILWQGAPASDRPYERLSLWKILIGLIVIGILGFVLPQVLSFAESPIGRLALALFCAAIVAQAFWVHFGRAIFASYKVRHSFYTLTNRRAIVGWWLMRWRRLYDWPIDPDTPLELDPGPPGNVFFAQKTHRSRAGTWEEKIGFMNIPDAQEVYDLIQDMQRGAA